MAVEISERDFQDNVIQLARILGWKIAHFRPAQTKHGWRTAMIGDPGFPDLVLARAGRVVFAELKSEKGKASEDQLTWLSELVGGLFGGNHSKARGEAVGVFLWRPSDLEEIKTVLQ